MSDGAEVVPWVSVYVLHFCGKLLEEAIRVQVATNQGVTVRCTRGHVSTAIMDHHGVDCMNIGPRKGSADRMKLLGFQQSLTPECVEE